MPLELVRKRWRFLRNRSSDDVDIGRLAALIFDQTPNGIVVTDKAGTVEQVNPAFSKVTGYTEDEVLGKNIGILKSGRHDAAFYEDMWASIENTGSWQGQIWNRRKNGQVYPEWLSIFSLEDNGGSVQHYVAIFCDISELRQPDNQLLYLAYHDPLTRLPNRLLFHDRVERAITRAARHKGLFALLFLDLDGFKTINDTWGHQVGDSALQTVAGRLTQSVRRADTIARFGGDEFVILIEGIRNMSDATALAQKLLDHVRVPIPVANESHTLTASIGIAIYPTHGPTAQRLIERADAAMYEAKHSGKNRYKLSD